MNLNPSERRDIEPRFYNVCHYSSS